MKCSIFIKCLIEPVLTKIKIQWAVFKIQNGYLFASILATVLILLAMFLPYFIKFLQE